MASRAGLLLWLASWISWSANWTDWFAGSGMVPSAYWRFTWLARPGWCFLGSLSFFQSLYLSLMMSLPVIWRGVSCSVRVCRGSPSVCRWLQCCGIRPAPILKCFLFVLLHGSIDSVLNQSLADSQQLRLVRLGPAMPTWGNKRNKSKLNSLQCSFTFTVLGLFNSYLTLPNPDTTV